MTKPEHDPDAVAVLISETHAEGGQLLTNDQVVEFISKPINLGRTNHLGHYHVRADGVITFVSYTARRGPKSKKSKYDLAYERRQDIYRRLVKLKKGVRLGTGNQRIADEVRDLIRTLRADGSHERSIVREVRGRLELGGKSIDETTIRRIKRTMK